LSLRRERRCASGLIGKPCRQTDALTNKGGLVLSWLKVWLSHYGLCPLHPQKRTLVERVGMSALCQKRTHAVQHKTVFHAVSFTIVFLRPDRLNNLAARCPSLRRYQGLAPSALSSALALSYASRVFGQPVAASRNSRVASSFAPRCSASS